MASFSVCPVSDFSFQLCVDLKDDPTDACVIGALRRINLWSKNLVGTIVRRQLLFTDQDHVPLFKRFSEIIFKLNQVHRVPCLLATNYEFRTLLHYALISEHGYTDALKVFRGSLQNGSSKTVTLKKS